MGRGEVAVELMRRLMELADIETAVIRKRRREWILGDEHPPPETTFQRDLRLNRNALLSKLEELQEGDQADEDTREQSQEER